MKRAIDAILFTALRRSGHLIVFALAACSAASLATSPSVVGRYDLSSYDGELPPVVLRVIASVPAGPGGTDGRCEDRLEAMRLVLEDGGHFTRTSQRRLVCDTGEPDEVTLDNETGTYSLQNTALTLDFDPKDGVATAIGEVGRDSIAITKQTIETQLGTTIDEIRIEFLRAR
jgi:hypothetical protein